MAHNVLIVTQSFPPLNNIAARRFGFLTPYMEARGWRPWVLTTEAEGTLPLEISTTQIARVGRYPRAVSSDMDASCDEQFRISDSVARGLSRPADWVRRSATAFGVRLRSIDCTCFTWSRAVVQRLKDIERQLPPIDLVIGTFGPAASLWLARRCASRWKVPWIADFRDLAALRPDGRNWLSRIVDGQIERRLLRSAAGITTVSPTLATILRETYGRPTETIYNGWDRALAAFSGNESSLADLPSQPYLYYAGRWYPERLRAASLVLAAMANRPDLHWLIRSLGPVSAEKEIAAEARALGLGNRVHLRPPCDPDRVHVEANHARANLVLDDVDCRERWSRGTLTGKFLELIAARPPVLAVTRPDSDMGPILLAAGKGEVCSNKAGVSLFLDRIDREPSGFRGVRDVVESFSKPIQAAWLCRFLGQFVPRPSITAETMTLGRVA